VAEFLLLLLISLAFVVVSIALAARYGVEALIIWANYKKGHVVVAPEDDDFLDEEDPLN
jgi:hypothetical protein